VQDGDTYYLTEIENVYQFYWKSEIDKMLSHVMESKEIDRSSDSHILKKIDVTSGNFEIIEFDFFEVKK